MTPWHGLLYLWAAMAHVADWLFGQAVRLHDKKLAREEKRAWNHILEHAGSQIRVIQLDGPESE
jgi:hypothetical protein